MPTAEYKLRVDPSLLFSIVFIEEKYFSEYDPDDLVTLDYKMLGESSLLNNV